MEKSILSKNIRKLRGFKNVNQTEFAKLLGIKRSSVGAYEEGRAEPKLDTLQNIVKIFQITIDDIITKELSVNDIANFKPNNYMINKNLLEEMNFLKDKIKALEAKIDLLIDKSK